MTGNERLRYERKPDIWDKNYKNPIWYDGTLDIASSFLPKQMDESKVNMYAELIAYYRCIPSSHYNITPAKISYKEIKKVLYPGEKMFDMSVSEYHKRRICNKKRIEKERQKNLIEQEQRKKFEDEAKKEVETQELEKKQTSLIEKLKNIFGW